MSSCSHHTVKEISAACYAHRCRHFACMIMSKGLHCHCNANVHHLYSLGDTWIICLIRMQAGLCAEVREAVTAPSIRHDVNSHLASVLSIYIVDSV